VFAIGPLGRALKRWHGLARWQNKIIGTIFITLGLKVALQKQ
jgi:threonine/homoserine/homoserine lactone efflux protein